MDKQEMTRLRDENRAAPRGLKCVCPRCGTVYTKVRSIQYSCGNKCGYWLRDNLGSFKKESKRRSVWIKPVNAAPEVGRYYWPSVVNYAFSNLEWRAEQEIG